MPVRYLYLSSGRSRTFKFGSKTVELRRAPSWQLIFGNRLAGKAIRALAWLGPDKTKDVISAGQQSLQGMLAA